MNSVFSNEIKFWYLISFWLFIYLHFIFILILHCGYTLLKKILTKPDFWTGHTGNQGKDQQNYCGFPEYWSPKYIKKWSQTNERSLIQPPPLCLFYFTLCSVHIVTASLQISQPKVWYLPSSVRQTISVICW